MKLLGNLVFRASDLPEVPHDSRVAPGVDLATKLLTDWLADGPKHYRELLAKARKAGLGHSTLYRAKSRLGVPHKSGEWSMA